MRVAKHKGADQLHGYREADLRLCIRLGRLLVFPCGGSYTIPLMKHYNNKSIVIL